MTLNSAKQAYLVWRRVRMLKECAAVDVAALVAKTHSTSWHQYCHLLECQLELRWSSAWANDPGERSVPL